MKATIFGRGGFLGSHLSRIVTHDEKARIFINCAARVCGIEQNRKYPALMMTENVRIALEAYEMAIQSKKTLMVNFGSTCAYSPEVRTPFRPQDYLVGEPEITNSGYAQAKRFIYKMGLAYEKECKLRSLYLVMPNLYGPGDKSDHVIPSLIAKFYAARLGDKKSIKLMGSGKAEREFLFVEDAARLIVQAVSLKSQIPIHLTSSQTITIKALAECIARLMGYHGELLWDKTGPDGQIKRLLQKGLHLKTSTGFEEGLQRTIDWYERSIESHMALAA